MVTQLRSLLVHVDAAPRSAQRLKLAKALAAAPQDAPAGLVTALYGVVPLAWQRPSSGLAQGASATADLLDNLDRQRRDAARLVFDRACGDGAGPAGPRLAWAETGGEISVPGFVSQSFCADALVLGQHDPDEPMASGVPADFVPSVLRASGKPALVVPYAGEFSAIGQTVLVAWKYSRESARAVASALPLLRRARRVHVAMSPGATERALTHPPGRLDILGWLQAHGVEAALHPHGVAEDSPGESLLSLACDLGADLLVMGCYGHSRMREWLLGGASRTVLGGMTLPVWMAS